MKKVRMVIGLEQQGHIPTIEKMLDGHRNWDEINKAIGWAGDAAQKEYINYLRKKIKSMDGERLEDEDQLSACCGFHEHEKFTGLCSRCLEHADFD